MMMLAVGALPMWVVMDASRADAQYAIMTLQAEYKECVYERNGRNFGATHEVRAIYCQPHVGATEVYRYKACDYGGHTTRIPWGGFCRRAFIP